MWQRCIYLMWLVDKTNSPIPIRRAKLTHHELTRQAIPSQRRIERFEVLFGFLLAVERQLGPLLDLDLGPATQGRARL